LSDANLSYAKLVGANLCKANLSRTTLYFVNGIDTSSSGFLSDFVKIIEVFSGTYRINNTVKFSGANLVNANLYAASLSKANFQGANLCDACLIEADLTEAILEEANLYRSNLAYANFTKANLCNANLEEAHLVGTKLIDTDLSEAKVKGTLLNAQIDFTKEIAWLSNHVQTNLEYVLRSEQQTKTSLILPFVKVLGYDIHNPREVSAEYIADFAEKKAGRFEKVDYALVIDNNPIIFIEAKKGMEKPESHDYQLRRYFNTTLLVKVGVVTNGTVYRFFTDRDNQNMMDETPFFTFNILDYNPEQVKLLSLFHRDKFALEVIKSNFNL
jgi:hypothetical protein